MSILPDSIAQKLDAARAKLATLPKPGLLQALPWDNEDSQRAAAIIEGQQSVTQLEHLLGASIRASLAEAVDVVSCIPEDAGNFVLLRRVSLLLNSLAKIEEHLI